jgi:hypothetical protein
VKPDRTRLTGASKIQANSQDWGREARERYYELTGFVETNEDAIWHHRLALFGPPCANCGSDPNLESIIRAWAKFRCPPSS